MVRRKNVAAILLDRWNDALHLFFDALFIIPQHSVDPAVQQQFVPIGVFDVEWIHSCFDLKRVQSIHADLDQFRDKWVHVTARVQAYFGALGMRPFDGALVDGLEQFAIRAQRKELIVLVSL